MSPRRDLLKWGFWLAVLAVVAAVTVPNIICPPDACGGPMGPGSRYAGVRSDMLSLTAALSAYKLDNATYPGTRQGLDALVHPPTGAPAAPHWRGYLKQFPHDPWGNPYHYASPSPRGGDLYVLWTYGADGKPGGEEAATDFVMRYPTDCHPAANLKCQRQ